MISEIEDLIKSKMNIVKISIADFQITIKIIQAIVVVGITRLL